jgi:hypothetical protein
MDIQIFSDFHGEAYFDRPETIWAYVTPMAPVAVVAGDIDAKNFEVTCNEIAKKFELVIVLLGNHEWYRRDINWRPDRALLADNVKLLDRETYQHEDVLFVGATLWTDFKNADWFVMHAAKDKINDFHVIKDANNEMYHRFTPALAADLHRKDRGFIEQVITNPRDDDVKLVVVTHFLPTYELVQPKWKQNPGTDMLNWYFAAQCDDLIEKSNAAAWIFGHTHDRIDQNIFDVRCVCNPIGYPRENPDYQDMVIKV